jgi:hypothetical protein
MTVSGVQTPIAAAAALPAPSRRLMLLLAVAGAGGASAAIGAAVAPVPADADLVLLIRFMAVVKAMMVLAAAGLVWWRLGSDIGSGLAAGYIAAVTLMAISPGVVWSMTSPTLASALFHSGLLFGLALAARDGFTRSRRA